MYDLEPIITPEHIRELWDAGLGSATAAGHATGGTGDTRRGGEQPALCLTSDGRVVVSDRPSLQAAATVVITAAELRNFTRGRFTVQDAREVAWALTEELRLATPA